MRFWFAMVLPVVSRLGHEPIDGPEGSTGAGLQVGGIDNLRVADASLMPHIATGNTMARCVIIGERKPQQAPFRRQGRRGHRQVEGQCTESATN